MSTRQLIPISLVLTILSWVVLSWPLPLHMTTAVTISAHGGDGHQIRTMIPSDALQLLYHFQLVKEWITGETPFFYNLYEFNVGDDSDRFFPGGYYFPFSVIYALGASLGGQAFGMNLAAIVSLWFTVFGTWLLLRRYVRDERVVGLFSLFAIFFPYRWITLFDASPTGYAMMWVPFIFLGLDMAVRDGRVRGGLLSAATLLLVYVGDIHVFFFSVLATPAWCMLALAMKPNSDLPGGKRLVAMTKALLPVAVSAMLIVFLVQFQSSLLEETDMAGGRSLREVAVFSPTKEGFLEWQAGVVSGQVYLGWPLALLMIVGAPALIVMAVRQPRTDLRILIFWCLLMAGSALVMILALGPHGLRGGGLFVFVRELVPPYAMIRQAGKVFSLMPTLMAVAGAVALAALIRVMPFGAWWRTTCLVVFGSAIFIGYTLVSSPALTRIQESQGAYQAVAEDAETRGVVPRALVVTLWPGDTHYGSVYQHFAQAHRVRIVNGYSPAFTRDYFENVFLRFNTINQGYLSDAQADALLAKGIDYILLHEDMYPEKVAPFPVTFAIRSFLEHSRLQFLRQDETVWAFRLLNAPRILDDYVLLGFPTVKNWETFFPARHWEMERSPAVHAETIQDDNASGRAYLTMSLPEATVHLPPTGTPPAPNLRWLIRARGHGAIRAHVLASAETVILQEFALQSDLWTWIPIVAPISSHAELGLRLEHVEGSVDLDSALLTAGNWPFLQPGETLTLPAPLFFHAGYTSLEQGHLVFRQEHDAQRIIFYGPKMPFEPGIYEISLIFDSSAKQGTILGVLHVDLDWNSKEGPAMELVAGEQPQFRVELHNNLPLSISFIYFGRADITFDQVVFTRIQ